MNALPSLAQRLAGRRLRDIVVPGYLDADANGMHKRFHPMFDDIYFQFDELILCVSAADQFWNVRLQLVDQIECRFAIDPDDEFCVSSIDFILEHPQAEYSLNDLTVFLCDDSRSDEGVVRRAALNLISEEAAVSETIFVDPQHITGLVLGGMSELAAWKDQAATRSDLCVEQVYRTT